MRDPGLRPGSDGRRARGTIMSDLLRWTGGGFVQRGWRLMPPLGGRLGRLPSRLPQGLRRHGIIALGLATAAGMAGSVYYGAEALYYQRAATAAQKAAETENAGLKAEIAQLR